MNEEAEDEPAEAKEIPRDEKPLGLNQFAILLILIGFYVTGVSGYVLWLFSGGLYSDYSVLTGLLAGLLVVGVLEIVFGIGFFWMKKWGLQGTTYVVSLGLVFYVATVVNMAVIGAAIGGVPLAGLCGGVGIAFFAGPILIHIVVLVYVLNERLKEYFRT